MQIELIGLQRDVGITFVFVTHSQPEALALSHRIAVMNDGRVEQLDEPSRIYGFPKNRFVADFIGNVQHAGRDRDRGRARTGCASTRPGSARSPHRAAQGRTRRAGGRARDSAGAGAHPEPDAPHDLKNHFDGTVHDFLYVGDVTTYVVELENGTRVEALLANSAPGPGPVLRHRGSSQGGLASRRRRVPRRLSRWRIPGANDSRAGSSPRRRSRSCVRVLPRARGHHGDRVVPLSRASSAASHRSSPGSPARKQASRPRTTASSSATRSTRRSSPSPSWSQRWRPWCAS